MVTAQIPPDAGPVSVDGKLSALASPLLDGDSGLHPADQLLELAAWLMAVWAIRPIYFCRARAISWPARLGNL